MLRSLLLLTSIFVISGCASINSVSLTPVPAKRSQVVTAQVEKTDNDYIDGLVTELKQKCPNGIVSGILTKDETISYFIVYTKRISATGFCNVAQAKEATNLKKGRSSASVDGEG
ncbi:MAG: hypothetical protein EOP05_23755 [Proteobacteria bacterium]|nr:MAG: hypothetical protein EOP05_23755 [Pseudomonadota bacterium]